jgi:WD repeat-containing protein 35
LNIERKDVWDLTWSEDDPDMLEIMEKTKMVVFHNETAEDPIVSSAYLARFKDLEVRVIAMDALMQAPDKVAKEFVVDFESKRLREVREKISVEGLQAAYDYADINPHSRLWKLLATAALEDLEFSLAEKCFVRCSDYYGIQFVKTLETMPDKMKARAEVAVYLQRFDEAESIYREIDRKDLAIQLRKRLGDYTRVVQLLQTGGGNDKLVREAWDQIGFYFADRMKWKKACQYFTLSHNNVQLIECYYRLEQFNDLKKIMEELPDESPLLYTLAKRFESVGMVDEAISCYIRSGNPPKEAIDCCVKCNKWDKALELAEKYDFPQVEGLLIKFAMEFVSTNRKLEAIELFRVANKPTEAAILIADLAETVITEMANPSLAKKLHVLSALEIERHRKRAIEQATQATTGGAAGTGGNIAQATAQTLETLMMTSLLEGGGMGTQGGTVGGTLQMTLNTLATQGGTSSVNAKKVSRAFANAWRGAAAYHYYMLALRQFYAGHMDMAMKTSIKLCEYDDILQPRIIYSLLCLTSLKNKFYGVCSKAFVKVSLVHPLEYIQTNSLHLSS